jgi:hypothetical protein
MYSCDPSCLNTCMVLCARCVVGLQRSRTSVHDAYAIVKRHGYLRVLHIIVYVPLA